MPRVALLFLVGSVAICGIPPLNGFVSEFLLYIGFFSQLKAASLKYLVFLAPVLALVGGLAAVAFSKLYSSVFLGTPRTPAAAHPHEAGVTMLLPMAFFALLCLVVGVVPQLALRLVSPAIAVFYPQAASAVVPTEYYALLGRLSFAGVLLLTAAVVVTLFWKWRLSRARVASAPTWGCGYQRGTARMQYGGTSFSELAVSIFNGVIRQHTERPKLSGLFPKRAQFSDRPTETLLERIIVPLFTLAGVSFAFLRRLQHGQMHVYMMYIAVTLFILMLWAH
jgi:hydrogenase-4 component B